VYVDGGPKLWDYAAGALNFAEAGCRLTTLEGDGVWSGEHVVQRSVVAALEPKLFERWVAGIRAVS
ncbi:inositol monophosphatase, partial [Neisseria meningitidis]